jgi:CheY-like chemotaxis protein
MPQMSGDDLARKIAEVLPAVPVVVLTAYPTRGRDLHARAVLQKPVDADALLGVIEQFCGHRR